MYKQGHPPHYQHLLVVDVMCGGTISSNGTLLVQQFADNTFALQFSIHHAEDIELSCMEVLCIESSG